MAELPIQTPAKKGGKRLSTRVDLTPMVDLGFLLITFFIFTTAMSQPTAMKLFLPRDENTPMLLKESGALTVLPAQNGIIYYYEGILGKENFQQTNLKAIRTILLAKKQRTPEKDFLVVIKPSVTTNYGAVVDILDEMTINDIKRYMLTNISKEEESLIQ